MNSKYLANLPEVSKYNETNLELLSEMRVVFNDFSAKHFLTPTQKLFLMTELLKDIVTPLYIAERRSIDKTDD